MVVAAGFTLFETMITTNPAAGGRLEGITWWNNPLNPQRNPNEMTFQIFGPNAALVLYAGQYAELRLAAHDAEVVLPKVEPLWGQDDAEAARILSSPPFHGVPDVEKALRAAADENVGRYWRAIRSVAEKLLQPQVDPELQTFSAQHPDGRKLLPVSRVIGPVEVQSYVSTVSVAEAAYLRWRGRDCVHGKDVEDWICAEQTIRGTLAV
jgi:hypothetical protein